MIDVKKIREEKSLTQAQLAKIMGVSVQTIKNWEAGKKIPSTAMMKLSDLFNVSGDNNIAANINGNNQQNSGAVIDALTHQLDEKDRQIDRLLGIIEKMNTTTK